MIWDNISTSKLNWMLECGSLIQNKLISPKIQSPKFQGQLGKKASDRKDRLTGNQARRYSAMQRRELKDTAMRTSQQ